MREQGSPIIGVDGKGTAQFIDRQAAQLPPQSSIGHDGECAPRYRNRPGRDLQAVVGSRRHVPDRCG